MYDSSSFVFVVLHEFCDVAENLAPLMNIFKNNLLDIKSKSQPSNKGGNKFLLLAPHSFLFYHTLPRPSELVEAPSIKLFLYFLVRRDASFVPISCLSIYLLTYLLHFSTESMIITLPVPTAWSTN